ncbi:MAG: MMPL family transporter, partial [Planctomycetaceae bacterium]
NPKPAAPARDRRRTVSARTTAGFSMPDTLAHLFVRWRRTLLVAAAVLAAVSIVPALKLKLDRSIESLYAETDPHLVDYRESKRLFGGDEFVIVAWSEPNLLDADGKLTDTAKRHIRQITDGRPRAKDAPARRGLSRVGGVSRASTQDLARVVDNAVAFAKETATERSGDSALVRAAARRYAAHAALERQQQAIEFARGILVSDDGETTAVVLRLLPEEESEISRDETFAQLREIAAGFADDWGRPVHVAGEPIQVHDAFSYVEEDGRTLFVFSLALLAAVLLVLFRRARWVLLPLAVTGAAVLWTRAALAVSGTELSMVSSMLNSLVTIVAVATVTHVAVRFRELRRRHERLDALRHTIAQLATPIFWTTATTVAGFLSLVVSDVMPVRSFGLMMALGTAMVLVAAAMIVPGGTLLWTDRRLDERTGEDRERHPRLAGALARMTDFARRHAAPVTATAVILTAFSVLGVMQMKVETDFSKNFRADSPIVLALDFIEEHLGGAGTWEVNFPAPETLTPEYLDRVRSLADRLRAIEVDGERPLTKVIAITDGLDMLPDNLRTSDPNGDLELFAKLQPEFVPSLYNPSQGRMRIVLRARERQSAETKKAIIDQVASTAKREFSEANATGLFVLLTYLIDSLLGDQIVSFSVAGAALLVMMQIAFRRPLLALVALVPNVLPILLLLGGMGLAGVPVNIGTAMIASVSIGLTIDSSIHYLSAYRAARDAGRTVAEALDETGRHVGVALVFATLALSAGFSVLAVSHFVPLIYFGVLVSLAMLGGLLGNLLLLPALVPWVDRDD